MDYLDLINWTPEQRQKRLSELSLVVPEIHVALFQLQHGEDAIKTWEETAILLGDIYLRWFPIALAYAMQKPPPPVVVDYPNDNLLRKWKETIKEGTSEQDRVRSSPPRDDAIPA